ncbi:MAG TPA: hypothetical protein ENH60_00910 [Pricia sp.]|uniref:Uncharacterized protein n=1 Tax=Pricia antarctica TaxID=641691 RepID=A0A831QPC9_9FLAO|nr:hypothetical protein [Pricia sp.]HEA20830.1 hypothetical protein [Pricia antarctica]
MVRKNPDRPSGPDLWNRSIRKEKSYPVPRVPTKWPRTTFHLLHETVPVVPVEFVPIVLTEKISVSVYPSMTAFFRFGSLSGGAMIVQRSES